MENVYWFYGFEKNVSFLRPVRPLSFMDAYSGYNQICMDPDDIEKLCSTTDLGVFGYKMMQFDLKNAGAIYQHLVDEMFKEQIGRNMEVCVDDMLVESKLTGSLSWP